MERLRRTLNSPAGNQPTPCPLSYLERGCPWLPLPSKGKGLGREVSSPIGFRYTGLTRADLFPLAWSPVYRRPAPRGAP
jgi:hypothetical protein